MALCGLIKINVFNQDLIKQNPTTTAIQTV